MVNNKCKFKLFNFWNKKKIIINNNGKNTLYLLETYEESGPPTPILLPYTFNKSWCTKFLNFMDCRIKANAREEQ